MMNLTQNFFGLPGVSDPPLRFDYLLAAGRRLWHDRTMTLGWIRYLLLAFLLLAPAEGAEWDLVTRDGREYVTAKSFCEFYHFPTASSQADFLRLKNAQYSIVLRMDSREAFVNGVRYWLSFGIRENKGEWLISRVDLVKLFEPLLRPQMLESRKPVIGVVIDPGHGGSDNGAVSARGLAEKSITLDTAMRLEKNLRAAGIKTVMTRRSDVFVDLYERAQRAASYPGYIFVSLHFNSASPDARGLETYACSPRGAGSTQAGGVVTRSDYQKVPGNDTDSLNLLLASEVHRCIVTLNPGDSEADRGVKRARFVVLKQNTVPAILIEGGFLSNRSEASTLGSAAYRQKLADAVARGVLNFSGIMSPEKRVTPPTPRPVEKPAEPKPVAKPVTVSSSVPLAPAPSPAPVKPSAPTAPAPKPAEPTPAKPTVETESAPEVVPVKPNLVPVPAPTTTTTSAIPETPSIETSSAPTTSVSGAATEVTAPKPVETPAPAEPTPGVSESEPPTTIYLDHSTQKPATPAETQP